MFTESGPGIVRCCSLTHVAHNPGLSMSDILTYWIYCVGFRPGGDAWVECAGLMTCVLFIANC